jgi:hypothetical protein
VVIYSSGFLTWSIFRNNNKHIVLKTDKNVWYVQGIFMDDF